MNYKLIIIILVSAILTSLASCSIIKKSSKKEEPDPRIKEFNFSYYFLEANKQKILGNYDAALQNYLMSISIDDTQASVYYEVAGILNMARDYPASLQYAQKSVELDKTDNEYYRLLLAFAYQNNNQYDNAAKIYETLITDRKSVV